MQCALMFLGILLATSIVGCTPQKGHVQTTSVNSLEQAQSLEREADILKTLTNQLSVYDIQIDRLRQSHDETRRDLAHAIATVEEFRTEMQRLNGTIEELQHRLHQSAMPSVTHAPAAVRPPPPETRATTETASSLYGQAMQAYQQTDYETAIALFTSFLSQRPPEPLAGQAQYWIGESLYAQHLYEAAIVAFDDVVQQYPTHPRAPTALLKQAYAFAELKDREHAKFFLQQVQKKYPHSIEASQAAVRLEQLNP